MVVYNPYPLKSIEKYSSMKIYIVCLEDSPPPFTIEIWSLKTGGL